VKRGGGRIKGGVYGNGLEHELVLQPIPIYAPFNSPPTPLHNSSLVSLLSLPLLPLLVL